MDNTSPAVVAETRIDKTRVDENTVLKKEENTPVSKVLASW